MSHIRMIVSYFFADVQNSVTFNGTLKPIAHIRSLMLRHICVFSNPLYFDSLVNLLSIVVHRLVVLLGFVVVGLVLDIKPRGLNRITHSNDDITRV